MSPLPLKSFIKLVLKGVIKMKKRQRQRENRRLKQELLDIKDSCGVYDPTPYEAVKEIIKEFKRYRRSAYGL